MRKALELALEALERCVATCFDQRSHDEVMGRPEHFVNRAITAIKEALAQPEQESVAMADYMNLMEKYVALKAAQPEQEPVAYINIEERKLEWAYKYMSWDTPTVINLPKIPLYTTPPQRTWIELTDKEREVCINANMGTGLWVMARAIEAELKEKNT